MSTFNTATQVKRAVADPNTDCKLPHRGSLSWGGIAGPAALAGTRGGHCELLHGDRWKQTNGSYVETIVGDQKQTVEGDQAIMIGGAHKETIVEHCQQNIIGPNLVTNHTVRNETRMGDCNITYGSFSQHDKAHDGRWFYAYSYFKLARVMSFELDSLGKAELAAMHLEFAPVHLEFKGYKLELDVSDNSVVGFEQRAEMTKTEAAGIINEIKGMTNKISVCDSQIAALRQDIHTIDQAAGGLCTANKLCVHSLPQTGPFA